jgi:hypothetical protein
MIFVNVQDVFIVKYSVKMTLRIRLHVYVSYIQVVNLTVQTGTQTAFLLFSCSLLTPPRPPGPRANYTYSYTVCTVYVGVTRNV